MVCEHCAYRHSWDCDDGLPYPKRGCRDFKLDFETLSKKQQQAIRRILAREEDDKILYEMGNLQKQNQRLLATFRFWRAAAFVTAGVSIACIGVTSSCVGRLAAELEEGRKIYEEHLELDRLKEQEVKREHIVFLRAAFDKPEAETQNKVIEVPAGGQTEPEYEYLGEFTITAYCPCEKCCGPWTDDITAMGTTAEPGVIAVDKNVIPLGSKVLIDGQEYHAEDTGGAIRGNRIDVYCESHDIALEYGVQHHEVWVAVK